MPFDTRATPPKQKLGIPRQDFPTPNPTDWLIVHENVIAAELYRDLPDNTPHPKFPQALLVKQETLSNDGQEIAYRRTYATPRNAQEAYNGVIQYLEEGAAYPIFVRSYWMRQVDYNPADRPARGSTCTAVVALIIVAGGAGYADGDTITLGAPGSGGQQATGVIQVVAGVIVAVGLTVGGSKYTSDPSVTINSGAGSGGSISAIIQPQSAVFVSEKTEAVEDAALSPTWIRVVQVYKTEPGPTLDTLTYTEVGEGLTVAKFEDLASSHGSAPSLTLNVLRASVTPKDSVLVEVETQTRNAPAVLNDRLFNDEIAGGARTTVTSTEVAPGGGSDALPGISATGATLDARIEKISEQRSRTVTTTLVDAQPTIYSWETDPQYQVPILTEKRWVNGTGVEAPDVSATPTTYGGTQSVISAITAANPTNITTATAHGISSGNIVFLQGCVDAITSAGQSPIDGFYTATVVDSTNFTIPVNVATAGTVGTVTIAATGTGSAVAPCFLGFKYGLVLAGDTIHDTLDYVPRDKWRTVQVRKKMPSLYGGDQRRRYLSSFYHVFPDSLNYAYFNWAFANNGSVSRIDFEVGLVLSTNQGFRGFCNAYVDEIITLRPETLQVPLVARWHPQTFDIVSDWGIALSGNGQATARAITFRIPNIVVPDTIHNGTATIKDGSGTTVYTGDVYFVGYLGSNSFGSFPPSSVTPETAQPVPVTDATAPQGNTYYPLQVTSEPWRDGAFVTRITYASFPP